MSETLTVVLDDNQIAGTITRGARGRLQFDYDDSYRSLPDATPLSVSMPTQIASHPDHIITPWLWGLLPESDPSFAAGPASFMSRPPHLSRCCRLQLAKTAQAQCALRHRRTRQDPRAGGERDLAK